MTNYAANIADPLIWATMRDGAQAGPCSNPERTVRAGEVSWRVPAPRLGWSAEASLEVPPLTPRLDPFAGYVAAPTEPSATQALALVALPFGWGLGVTLAAGGCVRALSALLG